MEIIYERLKESMMLLFMAFLSTITPLANAIVLLMLFCGLNFHIGVQADKNDGCSFSLDKAFKSVKLLSLYYSLIFLIHIGLSVYEEVTLAISVTKFVTLFVCYSYLLNILRNSIKIFPKSKALPFFYKVLRVEFFSYLQSRFGFSPQEDDSELKK